MLLWSREEFLFAGGGSYTASAEEGGLGDSILNPALLDPRAIVDRDIVRGKSRSRQERPYQIYLTSLTRIATGKSDRLQTITVPDGPQRCRLSIACTLFQRCMPALCSLNPRVGGASW